MKRPAQLVCLTTALTASILLSGIVEVVSAGEVVENSIGLKLVRISAGQFLMGSPVDEPGRRDDERQHLVTITRDFEMGQFVVTPGFESFGSFPEHVLMRAQPFNRKKSDL